VAAQPDRSIAFGAGADRHRHVAPFELRDHLGLVEFFVAAKTGRADRFEGLAISRMARLPLVALSLGKAFNLGGFFARADFM